MVYAISTLKDHKKHCQIFIFSEYSKILDYYTRMEPLHTAKYAVTLTLHPSMYKLSTRRQLNVSKNFIEAFFKKLHSDWLDYVHTCTGDIHPFDLPDLLNQMHSYYLVPELTNNYNVHWHGWIQFGYNLMKGQAPEPYWYNLFRLSNTIGYTVLKLITDEPVWDIYIHKDIAKTMAAIVYKTTKHPEIKEYIISNDAKQFLRDET